MALKFVIRLGNLMKTNHTRSGKRKYHRKLTDIVTTRIRYRVNMVKVPQQRREGQWSKDFLTGLKVTSPHFPIIINKLATMKAFFGKIA